MVMVMVMMLLTVLIITITAISLSNTEMRDGTYRVVISSRSPSPQLSQHIPTDGGLACKKTADRMDSCSTTGVYGVTVGGGNIVAIQKPSDKCS